LPEGKGGCIVKVLCIDSDGSTVSFMLETALRNVCIKAGIPVEINSGSCSAPAGRIHENCFRALTEAGLKPKDRPCKRADSIPDLHEYVLVIGSLSIPEEATTKLIGDGPGPAVILTGLEEPANDSLEEYQRCVKAVILAVSDLLLKVDALRTVIS